MIELVGASAYAERPIGTPLRRRAAAAADRPGAGPRPRAAAPRRAARQPRPAQPERRRGAGPADLPRARPSPSSSSPTTSTRSSVTRQGRLLRRRARGGGAAARGHPRRRAEPPLRLDDRGGGDAERAADRGRHARRRPPHCEEPRSSHDRRRRDAPRPRLGPRRRLGTADDLPVHGAGARGGRDRRRDGGRDRLVHGAAPADLRRPHARRSSPSPARRRRRWRRSRSPSATSAPAGSARWRWRRSARERRSGRAGESAAIGTLQAFALGLGFLFVGLYGGQLAGLEALLFGTFLGITRPGHDPPLHRGRGARWRSRVLGRPLLFASVDGSVARARRRADPPPRRRLPAAARAGGRGDRADHRRAPRLRPAGDARGDRAADHRPSRPRPRLSVVLAFAVTWLGLGIAYFSPYPVGFWVTSLSFGLYVLVRLAVELPSSRSYLARRRRTTARRGGGAA